MGELIWLEWALFSAARQQPGPAVYVDLRLLPLIAAFGWGLWLMMTSRHR